jgi:hypothetical protein
MARWRRRDVPRVPWKQRNADDEGERQVHGSHEGDRRMPRRRGDRQVDARRPQ